MYYCFIKEDLEYLEDRDSLYIQTEYAKAINKYCVCSFAKDEIVDQYNHLIDLKEKKVFLRSTYDNLQKGISCLSSHGAYLLESKSDIIQIEGWHQLDLSERKIFMTSYSKIKRSDIDSVLVQFLQNKKIVFVKSIKKGFSSVVSSEKLLKNDAEFMDFLYRKCQIFGESLLITEYLQVKKDSLGLRETRHIVMNGNILSSSRAIHSLKHSVPKSHLRKAREIVEYIKELGFYPQNYVLDIGEFVENGNSYLDIIEMNPISCSMCYVNNTIFEDILPEIQQIKDVLMMGGEYCYDAKKHPERYFLNRVSNRNYSFVSSETFSFL